MNTDESTERKQLRGYGDSLRSSIKDMKWPDLVKSARETRDLIYGRNPCYGTRDIIYLDMLEREIFRREEIKRKSI